MNKVKLLIKISFKTYIYISEQLAFKRKIIFFASLLSTNLLENNNEDFSLFIFSAILSHILGRQYILQKKAFITVRNMQLISKIFPSVNKNACCPTLVGCCSQPESCPLLGTVEATTVHCSRLKVNVLHELQGTTQM